MSDSDDDDGIQGKTVKIAVVGEPATGKSSLCSRYLGGSGIAAGSTQGAEVMAGQCVGLRPPVAFQLCDVAGNSLDTHMLANYLYSSDIVIFVYDLTNLQSFEKLTIWMTKIKNIFESEPKKPIMALFGNKSDLEHQRAVRLSCVQRFAAEHFLETFKGSARTGDMVHTLFLNLVSRAMGMKVHKLPPLSVNGHGKSPRPSERNRSSPLPLQAVPTHSLIMNRKALRTMHRKASSKVCTIH